MKIYQWLFWNGLNVNGRGWFIYCNGRRDGTAFNQRIDFNVKPLSYDGVDDWVEDALQNAANTLKNDELLDSATDCDFCWYRKEVAEQEKDDVYYV